MTTSDRIGRRPIAAVEAAAVPPQSEEAEIAVLGTVLLTAPALAAVLTDVGLAGADFYRPRHALIWQAMCRLQDAGDAIDTVTVVNALTASGELENAGGAAYIHSLPTMVPAAGAVRDYARIVKAKALWRARLDAGREIVAGAFAEDEDRVALGETALARAVEGNHTADSFTADQLADDMWDYLDTGGVEAFPVPFDRLNDFAAGGLRRGTLTLVGGHTSHGKSALSDQMLDELSRHVGRHGRCLRPWLYITEMDQRERTARTLARRTGLPHERVQTVDLTEDEKGRVVAELGSLPFGISVAAGWSTLDVVRHARHRRCDVIAVDCLHDLPYPDGMSRAEGLGWVSRELKRLAVVADMAVIATVWLNEAAVIGKVRPQPTLGDIRDSGQPKNVADNVLFVWQDQDPDTGYPAGHGLAYWAKCRGGRLGGCDVAFNGHKMKFFEARS